jgi:hypothetical protein
MVPMLLGLAAISGLVLAVMLGRTRRGRRLRIRRACSAWVLPDALAFERFTESEDLILEGGRCRQAG